MRVTRADVFTTVLFGGALVGALVTHRPEDWQPPLLVVLLVAMAVVGDLYEVESTSRVRVVGSLPAFVLAAVLLGPAPAAAVGVGATVVDQVRSRPTLRRALANIGVYAVFPMLTAVLVRELSSLVDAEGQDDAFFLLVVGAFLLAGFLNFTLVALGSRFLFERPILASFRSTYVPVVSSQLAHGLLTASVAVAYTQIGAAAIALAGLVLLTYQRLLRDLLRSQANAEAAEEHSRRLGRVQFGVVRAMLDSVHARDRMTARHSAAVARYARSIAEAAGCSKREQEVIHIAALLHDVGKFIFTDAIFWSAGRLSDEQWQLIKRHPDQGAEIVGKLDGYGEVAEIIRAHHERVDGTGYPRGLKGEEIPHLARMIAVADTYDVMTARDSYRAPVPPEKAIAELERVAGQQLDPNYVALFVALLAEQGVGFGHGDDADFEAELDFERRVRDYAVPRGALAAGLRPAAAAG
jgi:putative nucleotidyltransferase with HDIG domain